MAEDNEIYTDSEDEDSLQIVLDSPEVEKNKKTRKTTKVTKTVRTPKTPRTPRTPRTTRKPPRKRLYKEPKNTPEKGNVNATDIKNILKEYFSYENIISAVWQHINVDNVSPEEKVTRSKSKYLTFYLLKNQKL